MRRSFCGLLPLLAGAAALALTGGDAAAQGVKETVKLFNGKDLTNFYTYLGSPAKGQPRLGKNKDPEKVFSVVDKMIRISGKIYGGLITEKEYENYHLIVEFKWGEQTYPPREKAARDSGLLLHGVGEDGAASGVWLESIECQMIEGGTGDFILVAGKARPSIMVESETRGKERYYKPGAPKLMDNRGRFNWYARDPGWKDVKGFRGKEDVENPVGEWNTLECICKGDSIVVVLNSKVVNVATRVSHQRGKILIQSEGAELFLRRVDLLPLKTGK
jgi:hypothetical protein